MESGLQAAAVRRIFSFSPSDLTHRHDRQMAPFSPKPTSISSGLSSGSGSGASSSDSVLMLSEEGCRWICGGCSDWTAGVGCCEGGESEGATGGGLGTRKPAGTVFKILIGYFPAAVTLWRQNNQDANVRTMITKAFRKTEMKKNQRADERISMTSMYLLSAGVSLPRRG